jgi:hypothetical protein
MSLPSIKIIEKKIEQETLMFKGLNRMPVVSPGELSAMTNLSSRYFPCLYPRGSREVITTLTAGHALFYANGKFCWVDGTSFKYDSVTKGSVTAGPKSMVDFNGKIIILPDKKYYDYYAGTFGDIATCPELDYVCVYNNRIFGVKGSNVYATALGQYNVWNDYSGETTDSWATDVAEEGNFTGIIVNQNHVICTKANYFYELYGSNPSNFSFQLVTKRGCSDFRSLVEIDGAVFYLGGTGIDTYSGSVPSNISLNLNESYVSGAAGTDGRKYYISLYNGTTYNLYVYDTYADVWHREDGLNITSFVRVGNLLYALAGNIIYKFNSGTEAVSWVAETERYTEKYLGYKVTSKIKVVAELEAGSSMNIYYSIDDAAYVLADSITFTTGYQLLTTYTQPGRANSFRIKFTGTGNVKIFEMTREMSIGSDVTEGWDIYTLDVMDDLTPTNLDLITCSRLNPAEIN